MFHVESPSCISSEIVTAAEAQATVDTVNVALVAPAGTVTRAGTAAMEGLLLESATEDPPAGAAALRITRIGPDATVHKRVATTPTSDGLETTNSGSSGSKEVMLTPAGLLTVTSKSIMSALPGLSVALTLCSLGRLSARPLCTCRSLEPSAALDGAAVTKPAVTRIGTMIPIPLR